MEYINLLKFAKKQLFLKNIPNPSLDSEILLSDILKIKREKLLINLEQKANLKQINQFKKYIDLRGNNKPVAYILGKKEFWKRNFIVNHSVLIPRPDTEIIIEAILKILPVNIKKSILDIGTGSGCILISLLLERKSVVGTGLDISKSAIKVAKINAKIQQIENRIKFINSDIDKFFYGKYDLVVSNPPYIKKSKISTLKEDVKNFEPVLALDGGLDGSEKLNKVIKKTSYLLKRNGIFVLEIDNYQLHNVKNIMRKYNFYINNIIKDYAQNYRCIISTKY